MSEAKTYIIAYDVADARRLVRVHQLLKGVALAVQYSVFAGSFTARALERVLEEVSERIDGEEDDVRVYPAPERCEALVVGGSRQPRGVLLAGEDLGVFLRQELGRGTAEISRLNSDSGIELERDRR